MTIVLDYPHDTQSYQPLALSARDIWRLGEQARSQVDGGTEPALGFADLAAKSRQLRVNGLELKTCWSFEPDVRDDDGGSVLAAIEYDREVPRTALLCLNSTALAGFEALTLSTAAHELGHAVFDAPGWVTSAETLLSDDPAAPRRFRSVVRRYRSDQPRDPAEWRANEFMGAFLAPPRLMRRQISKIVSAHKLPRKFGADGGLVLHADRMGFAQVEIVVDELASTFGLSNSFIEYRLVRYGFAPRSPK